jgi:hypothetical protein
MDKYVVSRELAEKLKAAGYPQRTGEYVWSRNHKYEESKWYVVHTRGLHESDLMEYVFIAAPLSDELLEQLPGQIDGIYDLGIWPGKDNRTLVGFAEPDGGFQGDQYANKPADALAELWLWCKQEGHL